jgi:protein O-GlcNAc transferase
MTKTTRLKVVVGSRRRGRFHLFTLLLLILSTLLHSTIILAMDGIAARDQGLLLYQQEQYEQAAPLLWHAVLFHGASPTPYDVQVVFSTFLQCYAAQDKLVEGMLFVALESFRRGQVEMGQTYLKQALQLDPNNLEAIRMQQDYSTNDADVVSSSGDSSSTTTSNNDVNDNLPSEFKNKSAEDLYEIASAYFSDQQYEDCADVFELSCARSKHLLGPSCSNAVYCRQKLMDWGFNGTQFDADMDRIRRLTRKETREFRVVTAHDKFAWRRASSAHPHMMLSYPVELLLKRHVAESVAFMDEKMARVREDDTLPELPKDLPFVYEPKHFRNESKLKIGFVGSGFNSKAVLYLSQDMFRFFHSKDLEVHVFSFGKADNPWFLEHGMRGVDWRERVKQNVDHFHDMLPLLNDHVGAARYIHDKGIHILLEWDGYARQGERAQGLFALRPAPLQMLHQEYLGTSGALYVDYIFSDLISSPVEAQEYYTEKIIYLPNHFFSKGHAYQQEVKEPTYDYLPKTTPYLVGTGSPAENRCLVPAHIGPKHPSFVFCNFNKFLKNNPETVRSWIRILREVPDSLLCLVEYPKEGIPYLIKFIHEAAGTSKNNSDFDSFQPGDGDELVKRIGFLPWMQNPFDHQQRNQDFCNVMLDSSPYNGHTVAQDALYGGIPIVTRSDNLDMSSLVSTSANVVLGTQALNAYEGPRQYEDIAIRIGNDPAFYHEMRNTIIASALQRNPMHPYWDVARYVKNFEAGLKTAWSRFLEGLPPEHIYVQESELTARGTFDDEILAHPTEGKARIVEEQVATAVSMDDLISDESLVESSQEEL